MPLVLKLVGYSHDRKCYQIKDSFEGLVNLKLLNDLFTFWGLNLDEIDKIKFIIDSEQIKSADKNFNVKNNEDRIIFIFTSHNDIRNKLISIFIKEGTEVESIKIIQPNQTEINLPSYQQHMQLNQQHSTQAMIVDHEICKPLTQKETEPAPILTLELIDIMNAKSVSLFNDSDFKNLISIYIRRPELFNTLAQYVQHGNIIEETLIVPKTIEQLTPEELCHYQSLADKINYLNLGVTNDIIINRLIKYSGHLNLTVRAILCEIASSN